MLSDHNKKSIGKGIESFKSIFAIGGVVAAVIAVVNFISTLLAFKVSYILSVLVDMYRTIIYTPIDWLCFPFDITLPFYVKDILFLYVLIGGCFMRVRAGEGIYSTDKKASLKTAFEALLYRRCIGGVSTHNRVGAMYQNAPVYLQRAMDFSLWPRVVSQYVRSPMVHQHLYLGTFPTFSADYKVGEMKPFLYDRRVVFLTQLAFVIAGVISVFVINGFLTVAY